MWAVQDAGWQGTRSDGTFLYKHQEFDWVSGLQKLNGKNTRAA